MDSISSNIPDQEAIQPSEVPPDRGQSFVAPTRFSFRNLLKVLSIGVGGFVLVAGLGATVFLSQQNSDNRQHASANYLPPDGMAIFDSCGPTCLSHLDTFSQEGFKEVLDVSQWTNSTLDQVKAYAARADQDHIKIIWSLKDMWTDKWTNFQFYSKLTPGCGCTDKLGLAKYLVNQVKGLPATWGYWIGDEPEDSQHSLVLNLANIVHTADPNHPRIVIKNDSLFSGNASYSVNLGNFQDTAEVLGEDYYPVSYGHNLTATGDIANEVQYIANTYHRESTMVLEVNSGNTSDYCHATSYPSETQMAEMLTLTLQHSQPRMVLWYWYPCTSSTQWNNLLTAIRSVVGTSSTPTPTHIPPTPSPTPSGPTPTKPPTPTPTPVRTGPNCFAYNQPNTCTTSPDGPVSRQGATFIVTKCTVGSTATYSCFDPNKGVYYTQPNTCSAGPMGSVTWQGHLFLVRKLTVNGKDTFSCVADCTTSPSTPHCPAPTATPKPSPTSTPSGSPTPTQTPSGSPTPTGTQVVGDINGDGTVDILDYNLLIACFGDKFGTDSCTAGSKADLNSDGAVDGIDYNILLRAMAGAQ